MYIIDGIGAPSTIVPFDSFGSHCVDVTNGF